MLLENNPRPENRPPKRTVNGILLLDKPEGITSNRALGFAKRLYQAKKAGHTGSLDPIASGLLPICFGFATKFSQFLLEAPKLYQTTIKLGVRTASGDSEGAVIETFSSPIDFSLPFLEKVLSQFRGDLLQVPPMFSAIKYQGQPLYKLARQGIEIERKARSITIYDLKMIRYEKEFLELEIHASKGTYIRTLAEDIGLALGCGAHVIALRRTGVANYQENQSITFECLEKTLEETGLEGLDRLLLPIDSSITHWPDLKLSEAAAYYLMQGQAVIVPYAPTEGWVKLRGQDDQFLGVGEILDDGRVAPRRLTSLAVSF